ncbi:phosphoribosylformylglycinamidine synthase [Chitinophaga sancti]|uniref:Phosphoribosylformylglycinamidine synthase n=1 Tax=Chitinophaga sancti TaxID=1004 RepID=A0A1K1RQJ7_9BACT|nr:phosphoribosylformylglycinamidine synthase [Chitinophaga sancti]WQD62475.1 phosphoribosylformylglycinamidine synthase [Chitinophaga sancti]WQG91956.1 phosphoribosylformylglycinamidine synthase [Chitinophaga sancti]SFW74424.1 phosphoribosylformylglycinamidine synthase [Chitinophaga sancti]
MIYFFSDKLHTVFAVQKSQDLTALDISKLSWLFGNAQLHQEKVLKDYYVGPRAAMVTPWSTNAVEITQNMDIQGIVRIETYNKVAANFTGFDPMLSQKYAELNQDIFTISIVPEPIIEIEDIAAYNRKEGLSLSEEEVEYLNKLSQKMGRKLTDSEVFGFSQVNSEHCRHKIFNGKFVIDGQEQPLSLFKLIRKTSETNPNSIVSAYKDNVAFVKGPMVQQFAPKRPDVPDFYEVKEFESVISLKAETHNFPTTVEPFNGAATGAGGEIRDRLAGGQGSIPLAGTAVYMTALSRLTQDRDWEKHVAERKWLYQAPVDILIKASNGASDFGNKFGQPLITGSLFTFEHEENAVTLGYDKVIMQAGGIGYAKASQAAKHKPSVNDKVVILGGDNYRIGMGGAAVSSADTGVFDSAIELNAVQRSNPEMQKRVANVVRGLVESDHNTIISIHDHGAGGHLNCLSELVEETGGLIDLDKLPVGDPTLSAKEIIGNESQERMGIVIGQESIETMQRIAARERSPMYVVGEVTGDHRFTFKSATTGLKPMDLNMADMFGSSPKVYMRDKTITRKYQPVTYDVKQLQQYLEQVLQLEAVASKDWLVNKVDRCVSGRVAKQQCAGPLQLPLNNCGVMALDFQGQHGIATSIGHAPLSALISPAAGSRNAIAEALSNIVWAPLKDGITSVSLSANWMWPCKNEGEDARLYEAVVACSDFAIALGINIPTGKDSLSMKQKYPDKEVIAPGTVIISATGHCDDIKAVVEPVLHKNGGSIYYINLSGDKYKLGGSSFAQIVNKIGDQTPDILNAAFFKQAFDTLQQLIKSGKIQAGHDIGSGGLIVTLLELCFADRDLGANIDLSGLGEQDIIEILFAENNGVVFQAAASVEAELAKAGIAYHKIGEVSAAAALTVKHATGNYQFDIDHLRDVWTKTSYLLDQKQSGAVKAKERFDNYKNQPLKFTFPAGFTGKKPAIDRTKPRIKAAVLREKGSNSERELANALYLAGFDVKDVHMTDLISGRETLEDIQFLGAVGGFSNSDVLGSAKGWAGAFLYNPKAKEAIEKFFDRKDTLSVGICNGCQLFVELGLINLDHGEKPRMLHNDSHKHESIFTSVTVQENKSVLLSNLAGSTLGVWVSHGEGKFDFPYEEDKYNIVGKYGYEGYPANPNGSGFNAAMLCDVSGRHLVMMPHIERSIFQWNWANYPGGRKDEVTPWLQAFINGREWLENRK